MPTAETMQENHRDSTVAKFAIGHGIVIDGAVTAPADSLLVIHGVVHGSVKSSGAVEIGKTGEVVGSICAEDLQIDGCVTQGGPSDDVVVSNHLAIGDTGRLAAGTVAYGSLSIARGARVTGVLHHVDAQTPTPPSDFAPTATVVAMRAPGKRDVFPLPAVQAEEFEQFAPASSLAEPIASRDGAGAALPDDLGGEGSPASGLLGEEGAEAARLEAPLPERDVNADLPQFLMLRPQAGAGHAPALDRFAELTASDAGGEHA